MKNYFKYFLMIAVMLSATVCFADASEPQLPTWIGDSIRFLENVPKVGHIIVLLLSIIAVAATILTPLTGFLMAVEKATGWAELDKVNAFLNKIIPYVSMFSNLPPSPAVAATIVANTAATTPAPVPAATTTGK